MKDAAPDSTRSGTRLRFREAVQSGLRNLRQRTISGRAEKFALNEKDGGRGREGNRYLALKGCGWRFGSGGSGWISRETEEEAEGERRKVSRLATPARG